MMIGNVSLRPQDVRWYRVVADPNSLRYQVDLHLTDGSEAIAYGATLDEVTAFDRAMELCVTVTQDKPASQEPPAGLYVPNLSWDASAEFMARNPSFIYHWEGINHDDDDPPAAEPAAPTPPTDEGPQGNVATGDKSPESAGIYAEEPTTNVEFRHVEFIDTDLLRADQQTRMAQQIGEWAAKPTDTAAVLAAHDPGSPPPAAHEDQQQETPDYIVYGLCGTQSPPLIKLGGSTQVQYKCQLPKGHTGAHSWTYQWLTGNTEG